MTFTQSLPPGRAAELCSGSPFDGSLTYRLLDTSEELCVPNIWYNQPVAWRIDAALWYADRYDERAAHWRNTPGTSRTERDLMVKLAQESASNLRDKAHQMQRTGIAVM